MLKFLVDVGVGKAVESHLTEKGFDVISVRNLDPSMSDKDILLNAVDQNRLVITMDKDFGELVYNSGLSHAGVLILRLEAASGPDKANVVSQILLLHRDKIQGNFCVFQNNRLRIR